MSDTTEPSRETSTATAAPSRWKQVRVWGERAITVGLLAFVLYRLGPQLGALTGVGPDLGRTPEYAFVTLDGTSVTSGDLLGKVVVLNFWATWCGPCKLEMPALQSLHEDRDEEGVVVLGLSTDVGGPGKISEFLAERGITYQVGRASRSHREAFGGIRGIPTTFIIDKAGMVRHRVVGYFTPPAMRVAVSRLLGEEPTR